MSITPAIAQENREVANIVPMALHESDPTSAYLARLIEAWLAADESRSARALARAAGISGPQLSNIRHGTRGAGRKSLRGLAAAMGTTWPQIEQEAKSWAAAHPLPQHRGKGPSALPPALITALEIMRGHSLVSSRDEVERLARSGERGNLSVGGWIDEIQRLDRESDAEPKSSRSRNFHR